MEYTVIIPTHNRPDLVVRAIRSVYSQTCPPHDVIVIDDASQPPLVLPADLACTRVIRHERSVGGAAARNTGLREAATEIVAFLDDDDEWLPEKMEIQLGWLRDHPDASLVTCGHLRCEAGHEYLEVFTQEFVERYHQYDNFFGSFSYLVVRRSVPAAPPFERERLRPLSPSVRFTSANELPSPARFLLDPALPALQDWDFALRATRYSIFGVIEQPLVKYYAHDLPRITNKRGNHVRGLRRCYLNHRHYLSRDARRWLLGRVIFERSKTVASTPKRLARVAHSIFLAAGCRVPLTMKLRTIGRRAASLGISPRAVIALRSAGIAFWQSLCSRLHLSRRSSLPA
jgi:glycosyltransferase involved in cell wall biosynthesis